MKNKVKIWHFTGTIFIIATGTLLHFVYEWSGNVLSGVFGAVNESTWEHLKLLFWPALFFSLAEYFCIGKYYGNYINSKVMGICLGIFLIISLFYTYSGILGNNCLILDISVFVISVAISQYAAYRIILSENPVYFKLKYLMTVLIVLLICMFVIFTFKPPHIGLFKDPVSGKYGIR